MIPALAEETSLYSTLDSLAANPPEILTRFLAVVVVNHPIDAGDTIKEENRRTLCRLPGAAAGLPLAWVDAASPGRELPVGEGVGLARKLGFDLVLERLAWGSAPPLLIALDADTLVRPDYLAAIEDHFRRVPEGGAIVPFCHQRGETPEQDRAIAHYELFLRSYALGLALAGSPYAFPTVGSAMACRADAYLQAGGMNRRAAGEDFYFLQQLVKTAGVAPLRGTVVRPSARSSRRTPFGTGRSVARLLAGGQGLDFHQADSFRLLGGWLALADAAWQAPANGHSAGGARAFPRPGQLPGAGRPACGLAPSAAPAPYPACLLQRLPRLVRRPEDPQADPSSVLRPFPRPAA